MGFLYQVERQDWAVIRLKYYVSEVPPDNGFVDAMLPWQPNYLYPSRWGSVSAALFECWCTPVFPKVLDRLPNYSQDVFGMCFLP